MTGSVETVLVVLDSEDMCAGSVGDERHGTESICPPDLRDGYVVTLE